jgi:hypothetical protein
VFCGFVYLNNLSIEEVFNLCCFHSGEFWLTFGLKKIVQVEVKKEKKREGKNWQKW